MSKYIPKVGEAFDWRRVENGHWITCSQCIVHSLKVVAYEDSRGWIISVNKECEFRPIQTKTDVEREQLVKLIYDYRYCPNGGVDMLINEIQQAGFTIPKKIKRIDIGNTIALNLDSSYEIRRRITKAICNLLGDLVEQDKGGAE
jgi:hypothetical protein